MGRVTLTIVSQDKDQCYLQALAKSPSYSAVTSFNCLSKNLVEFGKAIKGFPSTATEKEEFTIGAGMGRAEFSFQTVPTTGLCELWVRIKGLHEEDGQIAEAFFPIDYLEPAAIESFSRDLIKMGTGHSKSAELKNQFEKEKA
ncbi:MAG: hypothetical protein M3Y08_01705 [Fibrobacterota bacterium]|nr:hypothetical protein [Fibrobacterota bacterium]